MENSWMCSDLTAESINKWYGETLRRSFDLDERLLNVVFLFLRRVPSKKTLIINIWLIKSNQGCSFRRLPGLCWTDCTGFQSRSSFEGPGDSVLTIVPFYFVFTVSNCKVSNNTCSGHSGVRTRWMSVLLEAEGASPSGPGQWSAHSADLGLSRRRCLSNGLVMCSL